RNLKKEVEYAEMDVKSQINLWVNKAYREMRNAEIRYQKFEFSIRLARENVKVNEKRFNSGLGTSLEVIDARLVLEKNQIERTKSLYDYYQSLTELYEASGNPKEIVNFWQN
ncbi:TolC family protein, partial [candidate division KSB1 bacterium]|nr:TolC family protein [candidate division KSB1 bacterium]